MDRGTLPLQLTVFALVSASFTNIYLPQPILPILQHEFNRSTVEVSLTVSFVILGIVISNLVFGALSDRYPIKPILAAGGVCVAAGGLIVAITNSFAVLVAARFFQGLFIPALTTSVAAWLARTLPGERLSVVMGSYVSATVLGGLGGRLLGGWLHPPLHWRYAFLSASLLILIATLSALLILPGHGDRRKLPVTSESLRKLLCNRELLMIYLCGGGGFLMFSPLFNYLPYRLSSEPFHYSTQIITLVYLVYVMGIFLGPIAGKMRNRFGGGNTLIIGTCIFGLAQVALLIPSTPFVIIGLLGVCAGFFTIHAVAVGLLNTKLHSGHGKANGLYVLFYYAGGWLGITGAGFAFEQAGWRGVITFTMLFLLIPLTTGIREKRTNR